MGYYTKFSLELIGCINEEQEDQILNENVLGYDCPLSMMLKDEYKWYSWQINMQMISKKYPTVLFKLSGIGEEKGDMWDCYFLDGKYQFCKSKVIYEKYDPLKLIE